MPLAVRRGCALATAVAWCAAVSAASAGASRPHLLLIVADQLRAESLGAAGNRAVRTPNLDWLAATGARFTRHYSSTPTCTPARAALLTGRSPWGHGMLGYVEVATAYPAPRFLEMGGALAAAGYVTAAIGKNHFENGPNDTRYAHGYGRTLIWRLGHRAAKLVAARRLRRLRLLFRRRDGRSGPARDG